MSHRVAVIGTGAIGIGFVVLFAGAGMRVQAQDADPAALRRARTEVRLRLTSLHEHGMLDAPVDTVFERVRWHEDREPAVRNARLVQECAAEDAAVKRELLGTLGTMTGPDAVLASSSSALVPSGIAPPELGDRVLVAHPGNPPYLLPVIELVASPHTGASALDGAAQVYRAAGLHPVTVRREVEGFVFNRLQGAVLREAYCLVRDGVASVEDVDEVMRQGLAPRWSVTGPFETADLNTRGGIAAHAERMGPAYARMGAERGQHDAWTAELVATVTEQRRAQLPLEGWEARVRWREERLMAIRKLLDEQRSAP